MINEAVRIIDAAFRDGTIGLSVKLAALPMESGDTVAVPTIYNEAEHGEASRDAFPETGNNILIMTGLYNQRYPRQRPKQMQDVPLVVRGIERHSDTALTVRRTSYLLDAIDATLAALLLTPALRVRNNWSLVNVSELSGGITKSELTDISTTWELQFTCTMNPPS